MFSGILKIASLIEELIGMRRLFRGLGPAPKVPRDRNGEFEPKIVPKHERRFDGFDDKILSMYARGMSTREIQGHLQEIYGVDVSPSLISEVTDAVIDELLRAGGLGVTNRRDSETGVRWTLHRSRICSGSLRSTK